MVLYLLGSKLKRRLLYAFLRCINVCTGFVGVGFRLLSVNLEIIARGAYSKAFIYTDSLNCLSNVYGAIFGRQ